MLDGNTQSIGNGYRPRDPSTALLTKWKGVKVVSWLVIAVALAYYIASIAWASNLQTPEGTVVCRCLLRWKDHEDHELP